MLNVPPVVTATLAALALVHAVRVLALSPRADWQFLQLFAFIPSRYEPGVLPYGGLPGGLGAQAWTFVTYALIHGDWTHLGFNAVWLLAFGSAVARRFSAWRFLVFFALTAAAGAAAHLATHAGESVPMVGASASISGFMAASLRFAFQRGGPLDLWRTQDPQVYRIPAAPLLTSLGNVRVLAFLAVWFGLNLLLGLGSISIAGTEQGVAWEAHIGGFLAGLLLFALFDPIGGQPPVDDGGGEPTSG